MTTRKDLVIKEKESRKLLESEEDIDINNIEDIEEAITNQIQEVNESKELFDNNKIGTKTDLSDDEVVQATKLKYMAKRFDLPIYEDLLQNLMEYKLSRNRKSRKEYIESMGKKMSEFLKGFGNGGTNEFRR